MRGVDFFRAPVSCGLNMLIISDRMLRHKFFHRAKKIAITDRDLRRKELKKLKKKEEEERKKKDTKEESESDSAEEEENKEREAGEKSNAEETAGEKSAVEGEMSPKAKKKQVRQPEIVWVN